MIDSHHHIWRQHDLPWLLGPEQPRIFGEYASIKRDYLIDEYLQDIKNTGVRKSVYVQANWAPNWAADEAAWVQSVADRHQWPNAIVAYADMSVADVRPRLERLNQYPLLRGIRQQLHWHENPQYRFAHRADIAADKLYQYNVALLSEYGWSFDLQIFASQVEHA
ncbi:MAG: amidohydrolase family protein, partial [Pseudomonadota bacterium]